MIHKSACVSYLAFCGTQTNSEIGIVFRAHDTHSKCRASRNPAQGVPSIVKEWFRAMPARNSATDLTGRDSSDYDAGPVFFADFRWFWPGGSWVYHKSSMGGIIYFHPNGVKGHPYLRGAYHP